MGEAFPTKERIEALVRALEGSEAFRSASAGWGDGFNGNVLLVFDAEEGGQPAVAVLLRLAGGRCLGAERVDGASHPEAGFVFRARRSVWGDLMSGKTDPTSAAMSGQLTVEGNYLLLLRYAKLAPVLVSCVSEAGLSLD